MSWRGLGEGASVNNRSTLSGPLPPGMRTDISSPGRARLDYVGRAASILGIGLDRILRTGLSEIAILKWYVCNFAVGDTGARDRNACR